MVTHETYKSGDGRWLSPEEVRFETIGGERHAFEVASNGPVQIGAVEKISGDKVKQLVTVKVGIPVEKAKSLQKLLKEAKLKVQAAIQGEAVRVSGAKKDDLQAAMQLVRKSVTDLPLQFTNFRD